MSFRVSIRARRSTFGSDALVDGNDGHEPDSHSDNYAKIVNVLLGK